MDSEEQMFHSLDFLLDYSKGTLWWVHESNKKHPGLSLARKKVSGLYSKIPMLIGTLCPCCGAAKALTVWHVGPEGTCHHDKPNHFSVLRPCGLGFDEFGRADHVTMNAAKPRLDCDEVKQLDVILAGEEVHNG